MTLRISLLISTYERPDSLAAVLRSVERQSLRPHQVVIGDDGSGPETAAVANAARERGLPLRHTWLKHDGFRAGRMRNHAAAFADGDYLVIVDDDMLLHRDFLADHLAAATKGFFVQGSRALLGEPPSREALASASYWPGLATPDVGNRKNLVHSRLLSRLMSGEAAGLRGIRTCNFAVWREDFVRVNGFNEDFVGWGREDSEFAVRLLNSGVRRRNLRFAALACHIHHPPRSREGLGGNDAILSTAIDDKASRCENGFNLHFPPDTGNGGAAK